MTDSGDVQEEQGGTAQTEEGSWQLCIACREPIPSDATICSHCRSDQSPKKETSYREALKWIGGVAVLAGLLLSLKQLVLPLWEHFAARTEVRKLVDKARTETTLGDYPTAIKTYEKALQLHPGDRKAIEEEVDAAMAWVRNFRSAGTDENAIRKKATSRLSEIFPILEKGLADATGSRKADILAHIGWAHWLNFHIAENEVAESAEKMFRDALKIDRQNVYANTMLGNWLLQTNGDLEEAKQHFNIAVNTGKERAFVRDFQIGGMIYDDRPGARSEVIRVANDMRKNGEVIDEGNKRRIVSFDYDLNDETAMTEALSAVPPSESLTTFLWLDDRPDPNSWNHSLIQARLTEMSGNKTEALSIYRSAQKKIQDSGSSLPWVAAAIQHLSSATEKNEPR